MNKIACRLNFLIAVLLTLMILVSVPALADKQGNEDTKQSAETTVFDSHQVTQVKAEGLMFQGMVGNFFTDRYGRALAKVGSFVSPTGAWLKAQSSGDEVKTSDADTVVPETPLAETPISSSPSTEESTTASTLPPNTLRYYLGSVINTGIDNGFSGSKEIELDDPHFGWTLGHFSVNGYTRVTEDANGDPIFLKTLGDTVTLWFTLEQDIENLNANDKLIVSQDNNGYDEYFGIPKTDFGHGALIIRHIDYQNSPQKPTVYTDYLAAKATMGADTEVELFEEGDYEVALDYEIKSTWQKVFGLDVIDNYTNYRIFFRFSVRNGNCMVYPFDVATKAELTNTAITESGFYLDLAKSRYLDINVKKEVLTEGADGLIEDTRFNRPAKDGDQYTEEGVYIITVSNRYTGQQTTKQIYVGTNDVLKAYVVTGLPIDEIEHQLANGAQVSDNGMIVQLSAESTVPLPSDEGSQADSVKLAAMRTDSDKQGESSESHVWVWPLIGALSLLCLSLFWVIYKRRLLEKKNQATRSADGRQEEETE